jgi:hypothetical protein
MEWYDRHNTKCEVAESVGVCFDYKKIWEYCSQDAHKAPYGSLKPEKQALVRDSAKERVLSYALIISSSANYVKIKEDLFNDYTKGMDNYPQT